MLSSSTRFSPVAVEPGEITKLLIAMREGRREAVNDLLRIVYDQLRAVAHRRLSHGADRTINTTTLVHEAYLKLFDQSQLHWNDRKHFFAVAATAMRQVVVDQARRRQARKRGGEGLLRVNLDPTALVVDDQAEEIMALNQALSRLSRIDERLALIVELRFFGGLSVAEVAEALEMSERTVKREWRKARALLHEALSPMDWNDGGKAASG
jgi:RNA polymerase sigma factor (TIGR02999 family)